MISQPNRNRMLLRGDDQQRHAGGQQCRRTAAACGHCGWSAWLPVAQAVDDAQQRDQEDRQQETTEMASIEAENRLRRARARERSMEAP